MSFGFDASDSWMINFYEGNHTSSLFVYWKTLNSKIIQENLILRKESNWFLQYYV